MRICRNGNVANNVHLTGLSISIAAKIEAVIIAERTGKSCLPTCAEDLSDDVKVRRVMSGNERQQQQQQ